MDELRRTIRFAARRLARSPGSTAAALVTLACAIGANTAIFSVIDGLLLKPLPLAGGERVMKLLRHFPELDSDAVSAPKYFFWRDHGAGFAAIAAYESLGSGFNLAAGGADGKPERIVGSRVSASFFAVFPERPRLGRAFTAEEDRPGSPPAVVLSDRLWRRRFGGDRAVVGRRLRLNGELYDVVGVMPPSFRFPSRSELWTPFQLDPASTDPEPYIEVAGRLRPGVSMAVAQAAMDVAARRFAGAHPEQVRKVEGIPVLPLQEYLYGPLRPALLVLLGAVGGVLLIACANLANLQLARGAARRREIAMRSVLGSSRGRILRELLAESLLLGLTGGGLGLLLGAGCLRPLLAASPIEVDRLAPVGIDARVLLFTCGLAVLSAVLFGLAPAWQLVAGEPHEALQEAASRGAGGRASGWTRRLLVAAEVAVALVLVTGATLLARSFTALLRVPPGFSADHVLTLKLSLPEARYGSAAALDRFAGEVVTRMASLPEVKQAALVSSLPLEDGPPMGFAIEGRYRSTGAAAGRTDGDGYGVARYRAVTPGFFRTLRIDTVRGRIFDTGDRRGGAPVVVINEAAARRYWPGGEPLGGRIILGIGTSLADPAPRTIVGIVRDVREMGLAEQAPPIAYVPVAQMPDALAAMFIRLLPFNLVAREARARAPGLADDVERQIAAVDPQQPVSDVRPMTEVVAHSLGPRRFTALLLGLLSLLALVLAAVGVYGVLSYLVEQRRREIGVRMALGATSRDVLGLVVGQGMSAVAAGIAAGLVGALALTRLLGSLLYGVSADDPWSFVLTPGLLALVAALACAIPARRATRVDPVTVLRGE